MRPAALDSNFQPRNPAMAADVKQLFDSGQLAAAIAAQTEEVERTLPTPPGELFFSSCSPSPDSWIARPSNSSARASGHRGRVGGAGLRQPAACRRPAAEAVLHRPEARVPARSARLRPIAFARHRPLAREQAARSPDAVGSVGGRAARFRAAISANRRSTNFEIATTCWLRSWN